ncbi:hypothetical protein DERP_010852 [Dermatophagoides pteronyssinus]|uniref:Uncharacterized protein n=1 Tax=Dermatophagoides pteronyssinus TaxID=6956 RepID=A0ABQ8JUY8_DERPT|nr:hypothetical protein DERP_010852 [Dermatophagoides pteronyssinus]
MNGLPKYIASVKPLLPPCIMAASTIDKIVVCGTYLSPHILSANSYSSCNFPFDTRYQCLVLANTCTKRFINSTLPDPIEPSDK